MKPSLRLLLLAATLVFLQSPLLRAADILGAPATIDYQGKALAADGTPLANTTPANFEMQFRLYDAQEGGVLVWAEKQVVTVSKGLFSVRLGEGLAIPTATPGVTEGAVNHDSPGLPGAFNGRDRFLGVTILISGQTPTEILPRLAFLTSPFSYIATRSLVADRIVQNGGASAINVSSVSYATSFPSTTTTLTDQNHTAIVTANTGPVTVNLPGVTSNREYYIIKTDLTANLITVSVPVGGTLNGTLNGTVFLKTRGESVVVQNIGGNDWWVISDSRDRTPPGTITTWAGDLSKIPAGYLVCDGTSINRALYADLFNAVGTAWGAASTATFNVPDLRGRFLRGVDGSNARDDDRASRTVSNAGGNTGNAVGTLQGDAVVSHAHSGTTALAGSHNHGVNGGPGGYGVARRSVAGDAVTAPGLDTSGSGNEPDILNPPLAIPFDGNHTHTFTTNVTGGAETRPENAAVHYIIKY